MKLALGILTGLSVAQALAADPIPGKQLLATKSLSGKGDTVTLVVQHTFEVVSPAESKVVETCSVGPCLAVVAHDPKSRKTALAHFDAVTKVGESLDLLLADFDDKARITIAGGLEGWSEELLGDLKKELERSGRAVDRVHGPYPKGSPFKCVRVTVADGSVELLADPDNGWMPQARYEFRSPLQRLRATTLYPRESATPAPPPRPMPPPIPPSKP